MEFLVLEKFAEVMAKEHSSDYVAEIGFQNTMVEMLREGALSGRLECYNGFGKYQPKHYEGAIFTTAIAVNRFLKSIESPYRMPGVESDVVELKATTEWKKTAWEIGELWMNEQRKKGEDPGVIVIAKYVADELSNRGITGARGKFLDFETIKREALPGITGRSPNGKGPKKSK